MSAMGFLANEAFVPSAGAKPAPDFAGSLLIGQAPMHTEPNLSRPVIGERDASLFPAVQLDFVTADGILMPLQRGTMVTETASSPASYWQLIPQFGRVWRDVADSAWSHAAFPLMLVNDTENEAHQGLASFEYRDEKVTALRFQFVQQTAPYLLRQHFNAWGRASLQWCPLSGRNLESERAKGREELANRLPSRPWQALLDEFSPRRLEDFAGPVDPNWVVMSGLWRDGTLYQQAALTAQGAYPYPLEMRFGVRSIMKSLATPLALLRLAEIYGPEVLELKVGEYVEGLHSKYAHVRFIDAANMASGFGGHGSHRIHPNDIEDGYLGGDYDAWYTAPSHEDKVREIARSLSPYPWQPGTVVRYSDQDFYVLGIALDRFLKKMKGAKADIWDMLSREVLRPIGVVHAPAIRTREPGGGAGYVWFNAGYYPTLEELARIALLYQRRGAWEGSQLLHRGLTEELLAAANALAKNGAPRPSPDTAQAAGELYQMGFHFTECLSRAADRRLYLPTMRGSGENEVILYPNEWISFRIAKAAQLPEGASPWVKGRSSTASVVQQLASF